jgi:hypothetical protein
MRFAALLLLASCASNPGPDLPEPPVVHAVTAIIVANKCGAALSKPDAKRAEDAMNKLVERCTSVPHGVRSFGVVLLPGGDLRFTGDADAGEDEVPICVVSHRLTHSVQLKAPCEIDIRLEQSKMGR